MGCGNSHAAAAPKDGERPLSARTTASHWNAPAAAASSAPAPAPSKEECTGFGGSLDDLHGRQHDYTSAPLSSTLLDSPSPAAKVPPPPLGTAVSSPGMSRRNSSAAPQQQQQQQQQQHHHHHHQQPPLEGAGVQSVWRQRTTSSVVGGECTATAGVAARGAALAYKPKKRVARRRSCTPDESTSTAARSLDGAFSVGAASTECDGGGGGGGSSLHSAAPSERSSRSPLHQQLEEQQEESLMLPQACSRRNSVTAGPGEELPSTAVRRRSFRSKGLPLGLAAATAAAAATATAGAPGAGGSVSSSSNWSLSHGAAGQEGESKEEKEAEEAKEEQEEDSMEEQEKLEEEEEEKVGVDVEVEEAVKGKKARREEGKKAGEEKKKETGAGPQEAQKNPLEHATSLPEPFRGTNASRKLQAKLRGEQEMRTGGRGGGLVSPQRVLQRHSSNHVSPRPVMTVRRSSEVALVRANTSSSLGSGSAGSGRGRGALGHLKRKQGSEARIMEAVQRGLEEAERIACSSSDAPAK